MSIIPITALSNGKNYQDFVKQSIIGHLLADGTLVKKYKGGGNYFKFAQSEVHLSYLDHVFSLFNKAGLCNMTKPEKGHIKNTKTGKIYTYYYFITKSLVEFNELESLFYIKNKGSKRIKIVPANIANLLTEVGLAYWFMVDGNKTGKGIHLNTNCFTTTEITQLIQVLHAKFDLKCSLHSRNRIYIWSKSTPKFITTVTPFIVESMKYKIR
jgi:hypothetical protein